ncbi:secreted protein [Rhodopirellula baltica WH47]|uniref:Secreted protein n=1 Tax=Rhodopirellula baltica WH47 TaxID=991778 RepID=F2AZL6_RHOBT|nr:secreted protein [Rhodopirellula baltica WH47]
MKHMRTLMLLIALVTLCGCNTATQDAQTSSPETTTSTEPSQPTADDSATYVYHRDVAFTDVTKTMPDGSVDHIDFTWPQTRMSWSS